MKITWFLIIVNILVFLLAVTNPEYYIGNYGFSITNLLSGRYETLITSLFIHSSFLHLFFNMIALFFLGMPLEKKLNSWKYILIYFLSGILGNLIMFIPFYPPDTLGVGASGAISGLVGVGTFLYPGKLVFFQTILPIPFVLAGVIYFLSTTFNLFIPSHIAYPVHLMGFIMGSIFGLIWAGKNRKKSILVFVLVLILVIIFPYILEMIL
ncbi:MAG: rhomboid family intramembrane serine protease [Candidatus Aenigmarchaeota archaeon]|nr:rhomboid family intramembrane serine protease [Candidatus Aenigmarchaeota archaeon]